MSECFTVLAQVEKTIAAELEKVDNWIGMQWRSKSGQVINRLFCDVTAPGLEPGWRVFLQHYLPSPAGHQEEFELHVAPVAVRVFQGGHCVKLRKKLPGGGYSATEEIWPKDGSKYAVDETGWEYALHIPPGIEAYTLVVRGKKFADVHESGTFEMFEPLHLEQRHLIFDYARQFYADPPKD